MQFHFQVVYCHVNKRLYIIQHFIPQINTVAYGVIKACITTDHKAPQLLLIGVRMRKSEEFPAAQIVCPTLGRRDQHVARCCANIPPSFMCMNSLFRFSLDF